MKGRILVILVLCLSVARAQDDCKPLWPRLEFGNVFSNSSSSERLIIKFNTRAQCPKSYVTLEDSQHTIRKQYCESSMIKGSSKMNHYTTFIQRCSIERIEYQQKIDYRMFGSNSSTSSDIPFSRDPITTVLLNPDNVIFYLYSQTEKTVNLVFLGDWGELHEKLEKYTSINNTLDKVVSQQEIDGIIINGDIAYDLDSNNGTNYEEFLALASRAARYVPFYTNTGNHEHNSADTILFFQRTFEQYGKDINLVTGLNLGSLYLITFDPNQALYTKDNKKIQKKYPKQVVLNFTSYKSLHNYLQRTKTLTKPIILNSHYPLACSGKSPFCSDTDLLEEYIDLMFQYNIKFYIGAHYHTFERIQPYCSNKQYQITDSNNIYLGGRNCLVSIVEGIAGNNDKIIQSYDSVQNFTAALSYGKTGLGIMNIDTKHIHYRHYSSVNIMTLQDESRVYFGQKPQSSSLSPSLTILRKSQHLRNDWTDIETIPFH